MLVVAILQVVRQVLDSHSIVRHRQSLQLELSDVLQLPCLNDLRKEVERADHDDIKQNDNHAEVGLGECVVSVRHSYGV